MSPVHHGNGIDFLSFLSAVSVVLEYKQDELPPYPTMEDMNGVPLNYYKGHQSDLPSERMPVPQRRNDYVVDFRVDKHYSEHLNIDDDVRDLRAKSEEQEADDGTSSIALLLKGMKMSWKAKLYSILEEPDSSKVAGSLSAYMGVLIVLSVATLVLEPIISPPEKEVSRSPEEDKFWTACEMFFTASFTIEYLLRLAVCNAPIDPKKRISRLKFIVVPANVCDFLAVIPTYVDLAMDADSQALRLVRVIRLFRLSRMARIGRLANKTPLAAPVSMVLVVIWGIYMNQNLSEA